MLVHTLTISSALFATTTEDCSALRGWLDRFSNVRAVETEWLSESRVRVSESGSKVGIRLYSRQALLRWPDAAMVRTLLVQDESGRVVRPDERHRPMANEGVFLLRPDGRVDRVDWATKSTQSNPQPAPSLRDRPTPYFEDSELVVARLIGERIAAGEALDVVCEAPKRVTVTLTDPARRCVIEPQDGGVWALSSIEELETDGSVTARIDFVDWQQIEEGDTGFARRVLTFPKQPNLPVVTSWLVRLRYLSSVGDDAFEISKLPAAWSETDAAGKTVEAPSGPRLRTAEQDLAAHANTLGASGGSSGSMMWWAIGVAGVGAIVAGIVLRVRRG